MERSFCELALGGALARLVGVRAGVETPLVFDMDGRKVELCDLSFEDGPWMDEKAIMGVDAAAICCLRGKVW